jgi:hypothetical protein
MSQHNAPDDRRSRPFSVRRLVGQVLDETNLTDVADIAAKVTSMLTAEQHAATFEQAMLELVRQEMTRRNMGYPKPGTPARPSWKMEGTRTVVAEAWRQTLRDRIAVADNVRKMLGECTYEDLMVAANERFAHARQNEAKAEWFMRLADTVKTYQVPRLDALPADVLREVVSVP